MVLNFKWLKVPKTNELKEVQTVQTWQVQWTSRYGPFRSETQEEREYFTSEEDAHEFADSLRKAFKLIRHTSDTSVTLIKS